MTGSSYSIDEQALRSGAWRNSILSVKAATGARRAGLAFAAGVISALALPPLYLIPFLVVGLTMLVVLLDGAAANSKALAIKRSAWSGWWYGFGYFLAGLYWIGYAFLVEADVFAWMIPFVVVLLPAGLAIFYAGAAAAAQVFWSRGPERIAVLGVAWVAFEWLRGHVLTGFPWNLIGYVWMMSPEMSQVLAFIGIFGLSLVTVITCASPALLVSSHESRKTGVVIVVSAVVIVTAMWIAGASRLAAHPPAFVEGVILRLVQPSVPQADKWQEANRARVFDLYLNLTSRSGYEQVTHVVWPEASVPYILSRDPDRLAAIIAMLGPNRVLIAGDVRYEFADGEEEPRFFNSLHVIAGGATEQDSRPGIVATYDKYHLVPFGEYLPLEGLLSRLGLRRLAGGGGAYSEGPGLVTLSVPGAPNASPLICYEIIFPGSAIAPGSRPGWIVNLTNDAWFGDSSGPRQHLAMAQARAIETGIPVVRAANNGISAFIDPLGRIDHRMALNQTGVLDGWLAKALESTIYSRIGDVVIIPLALIFLLSIFATGRVFMRLAR